MEKGSKEKAEKAVGKRDNWKGKKRWPRQGEDRSEGWGSQRAERGFRGHGSSGHDIGAALPRKLRRRSKKEEEKKESSSEGTSLHAAPSAHKAPAQVFKKQRKIR